MTRRKIRDTDPKKSRKRRLKRVLIIIAVILLVLVGLYFCLKAVLQGIIDSKKPISQTDDDYISKSFRNYYAEDYDADIYSESDYMALDRNLMYSNQNGETYNISDLSDNTKNEGQRFFENYFDVVINGKYGSYPALFTDGYKKEPVGFEKYTDRKFTPQRIYNINIRELARTDSADESYTFDGKKCVFGFYEVSYKILRNDGTFRRDLPENGERPLVIELVTFGAGTDSEKSYIKNLYTWNSVAGESDTRDNASAEGNANE